jgi:allantoin racemase
MKFLLINPNTTSAMTEKMATLARARFAGSEATSGHEIMPATGRFGGRYVACRATYAIAGHAALDAYAAHDQASGGSADAILLACFGDPGLWALRDIAHQPVIGMAEASCLHAASLGGRFAIVTGGERWGPMLREFVATLGLGAQLAAVETVAPTGGDIARDPDGSLDLLARACQSVVDTHGATSVILGGAGLAGLAARIQPRVSVPLIDSLDALLDAAVRLATPRTTTAHMPVRSAGPTADTIGLAPELEQLLALH